MGRGRTVEPAIVRQRLARLAGPSSTVPTPADGPIPAPPPAPSSLGATPRWLDPAGWAPTETPTGPDDFSVAELVDGELGTDGEADGGHRFRPTPPAAIALTIVGVAAAIVAAYLALRAPDEVVPVVNFPASAGPTTLAPPDSATPGPGVRGPGVPGSAAPAAPAAKIVISVVGLVNRPGLVRMAPQARVAEAIAAAGGPKPGADLLSLNLARPLRDGDQVVVGLADAPGRAGLRSTVIGVDGPVPAPMAPGASASPGSTGGAPSGGKVNLNTATAEQLDALPGVGPVTAKAIIDWRSAHGGFTSVDQLAEVDGIGPARLQRLRDLVTVEGR